MHAALSLAALLLSVEAGESLRLHVPPEAFCREQCYRYWATYDFMYAQIWTGCSTVADIAKCRDAARRTALWAIMMEIKQTKQEWELLWEVSRTDFSPARRQLAAKALMEMIGPARWARQQWPPAIVVFPKGQP